MKRTTSTALAVSTVLLALSFHPNFVSTTAQLGILSESYPGELEPYRPLFRVVLTAVLSMTLLHSKLIGLLCLTAQTAFSVLFFDIFKTYQALFSAPQGVPDGTANELALEVLAFFHQYPLLKSVSEMVPYLFMCLLIFLTQQDDDDDEPVTWEPKEYAKKVQANLSNVQSETVAELKQKFDRLSQTFNIAQLKEMSKNMNINVREKLSEKAEDARNFIKNFDVNDVKLKDDVKREAQEALKRAKEYVKYIEDNLPEIAMPTMEQINHSLVPEALTEQTYDTSDEEEDEQEVDDNSEMTEAEDVDEEELPEIKAKNKNYFENLSKKTTVLNDSIDGKDKVVEEDSEEEEEVEVVSKVKPGRRSLVPKAIDKPQSEVVLSAREEAAKLMQERAMKRIEELRNRKNKAAK